MTAEAPADTGGGRARRRARRTPLAVLGVYLGLAAAAAIALLPFALSLMTALARDPARRSPLAPPDPWPPDSFGAVLGDPADLAGAARTTLAAVAVVTCAQVTSSVLAAYAFAQLRFPGREPLFRLFLVAMTIPTAALVVPLYLMAAGAGLRNTFWGVVVPFMLASPGAVLLLRESFRSVPRELIDAARIDGAGHMRILTRIVIPASRPTLAALTLITAVNQWNSFMWPRIIANQRPRVVTVAAAALQFHHNAGRTRMMAAAAVVLIPVVVLLLALRRRVDAVVALTGAGRIGAALTGADRGTGAGRGRAVRPPGPAAGRRAARRRRPPDPPLPAPPGASSPPGRSRRGSGR
mgnify:FL=1